MYLSMGKRSDPTWDSVYLRDLHHVLSEGIYLAPDLDPIIYKGVFSISVS